MSVTFPEALTSHVQGPFNNCSIINSLYFGGLPSDTLTDSCCRGKPTGKWNLLVMGHFLKSSIYKADISPHSESLLPSGSSSFLGKRENWHGPFNFSL